MFRVRLLCMPVHQNDSCIIMHTVQNHSLRRRKDSKFFPICTNFGLTKHPVPKPVPVNFQFPMFVLLETKCDGKCPTIAECNLNYTHRSGDGSGAV